MTYVEWLRVRAALKWTAIVLGALLVLEIALRLVLAATGHDDALAFVHGMQTDPGSHVVTTRLPDGTQRTTIDNAKHDVNVVIDDNGYSGKRITITSSHGDSDTPKSVTMGSVDVRIVAGRPQDDYDDRDGPAGDVFSARCNRDRDHADRRDGSRRTVRARERRPSGDSAHEADRQGLAGVEAHRRGFARIAGGMGAVDRLLDRRTHRVPAAAIRLRPKRRNRHPARLARNHRVVCVSSVPRPLQCVADLARARAHTAGAVHHRSALQRRSSAIRRSRR